MDGVSGFPLPRSLPCRAKPKSQNPAPSAGFSTPDINEAMVKECALSHTQQAYILCDSSKFYHTSPVTFGEFEDGIILTDRLPDESFKKYENIVVVP